MAPSIVRTLALLAALALAAACSPREAASDAEPTPTEAEPTPDEAPEPEANTPAETVDPNEVMLSPARLTVNADEAGAVYVDGRPMADTTPLETAEVAPGRHRVQLAWDDGAVLGDPRPALLRSDGNVILYMRRAEVVREASDPGVVRTEDELAEIDARLTLERAAGGDEGSGDTPDAADEGSGDSAAEVMVAGPNEHLPEGSSEHPEHLPEGSPEHLPEGSDDGSERLPEGSPEHLPEGSGDGETDAPTGIGYLRIDAEPVGTLYVNGHRTELTTPIILERPAGEVGIQLMFESGELSRHVDVAIADERLRRVRFEGRDLVVIR